MQQTLTRERTGPPAAYDSPTSTSSSGESSPAPASPTISAAQVAVYALRLFLAFTFLYAGLYKLRDPGFLNPKAPTYIGHQLAAFAFASPLKPFLLTVAVPNAQLFGWMVVIGELAIGLGLLTGALFRVAAFFGVALSTILWLSATWAIRPYFYGSDIFVVSIAVTQLLAGTGGLVALDPLVSRRLLQRDGRVRRAVAAILGPAAAGLGPQQPTLSLFGRTVGRRALVQTAAWVVAVAGTGAGLWLLVNLTKVAPAA